MHMYIVSLARRGERESGYVAGVYIHVHAIFSVVCSLAVSGYNQYGHCAKREVEEITGHL